MDLNDFKTDSDFSTSKRLEPLNSLLYEFHSNTPDWNICKDFINYLGDTQYKNIRAKGFANGDIQQPVQADFGYPHRYSPKYLKGRLAKLYQLDDWYKSNKERLPITFLTMTLQHKDTFNSAEDIRSGFERLQEAKRDFMKIWSGKGKGRYQINKGLSYVQVAEPHKVGFPHYHVIIFREYSDVEKDRLCKMWEEKGYGSYENGLKFDHRPNGNIRGIRNYLMSYMKKSFVDYSSKHEECHWTKEQLLFNAVAWNYGFRTWCASNDLSKVMAYHPDHLDTDIDWWHTEITMGVSNDHDSIKYPLWSDMRLVEKYREQRRFSSTLSFVVGPTLCVTETMNAVCQQMNG